MKKQNPTLQDADRKKHEENLLKRHKEELARKKAEKEKKNNEYFRKRVRAASSKKAPLTLRTRSYYRFAKEYPNAVDEKGYRENLPPVKKLTPAKKLLVFLLSAAVFCLSFTGVKVGLALSMRDDPALTEGAGSEDGPDGIRVLHFTYNELRTGSAAVLAQLTEENGCSAALFEFKDEKGYVNFDVGSFLGASADRVVPGAWDTVKGLEEAGIRTFAYISCYKDTVAASARPRWAVTDYDHPSVPLTDSTGSAWLDPFNTEVSEYLNGLIEKACQGGFSYVILDNLGKPDGTGLTTPFYPAVNDTGSKINGAVTAFVRAAFKTAGKSSLVLMSDVYGITAGKEDTESRYGGTLLGTAARQFAVDARLSGAGESSYDPDGLYTYIREMPPVFILDSCLNSLHTVKDLENAAEYSLFVCTEKQNAPDLSAFAEKTGMRNIIVW